MLFMVVCAVGFGWLGKRLDETRREQAVVAKIEKLEGRVWYHEMKEPDGLARHFCRVRGVDLDEAKVTDESVTRIF